jgi:hypothetical protein
MKAARQNLAKGAVLTAARSGHPTAAECRLDCATADDAVDGSNAQTAVIARRHGGQGNLDPLLPFKD